MQKNEEGFKSKLGNLFDIAYQDTENPKDRLFLEAQQ